MTTGPSLAPDRVRQGRRIPAGAAGEVPFGRLAGRSTCVAVVIVLQRSASTSDGASMTRVAALVLAAGQGARFGAQPKLLALLDGKPLVRHAAEAALAALARPVVVVLGCRADAVRAALDGLDVTAIRNPGWREGLSTSLKVGFAALPPGMDGVLVLLGDMPRVRAGILDRLIAAWSAAGRLSAVVPTFRGRRGNPVLLSGALAPEIARLTGDAGAGALLRSRSDVLWLALDDAAVVQDVDTVASLRALQATSAAERARQT